MPPPSPNPPLVTATDVEAPFDPAYFETVFVVPQPPAPWPRVFAIVTAHNPDGQLSSDSANNQYGRELADYLRREGIESFAVVGASADLSHHEAGRGFATGDLATASAISTRFRQRAFFWVEDGVVSICIDASGEGWKVGRWDERLVRR
jgi:hypothetical protein